MSDWKVVKECYNSYMKVKRIEPVVIENFFTQKEIDLI